MLSLRGLCLQYLILPLSLFLILLSGHRSRVHNRVIFPASNSISSSQCPVVSFPLPSFSDIDLIPNRTAVSSLIYRWSVDPPYQTKPGKGTPPNVLLQ